MLILFFSQFNAGWGANANATHGSGGVGHDFFKLGFYITKKMMINFNIFFLFGFNGFIWFVDHFVFDWDRVCMEWCPCGDCICGDCICGEMHSMRMSWRSELNNKFDVRCCFRYISCPCSDHSDSMHETAGDSLTSTRRISVSSCAMSVRWLISVVSSYDWNSI